MRAADAVLAADHAGPIWAHRRGLGLRTAAHALLFACAAVACGPKPTPPWHEEAGYRWRELAVRNGRAGFERVGARRSGIRFTNRVSDSLLLRNRMLGQGAGVAIGDVDGDGVLDVFLARTEGCSALYRGLGDWRFEDATEPAGVGACGRNATGAALADFDGDRDLDLILLATGGPNAVFVNDGRGRFRERRDLGLDPLGKGGTTPTMADVDGDGWLDLYVANYKPYSFDDSVPPQQRAFNRVVRQVGENKYEIVPEFASEYRLVNRPDMGGQRLSERGARDDFYRNTGGRFIRVPMTSARFRDHTGRPLASEPESFALAAKFADLNGDGAPDLYVANDFEDLDELWFNDGKGGFQLADWHVLRQMSNAAMGVDIADVDGDSRPDIVVADMLSNETHRLRTQLPTHSPLPKVPGALAAQLQQQRNTMYRNRGDGTFAEVGQMAGAQASGWSWATMFMDVDLDGWQDLLFGNGHLWDIMDADAQERAQSRLVTADWRRLRWEFPRLPLKNVALRNRGDLTFADASAQWRFGVDADVSNAMAAGDLDGDGDLDVVINRLDDEALVLRNESPAPRVAVRLVGDRPNTSAVGAMIRLRAGSKPAQQREVAVGGLYLSHSDFAATFAIGAADTATIEVNWRDGRRTVLSGVTANRLFEITASTATADPRPETQDPRPKALFEDASGQLGGHTHREAPFDDWQRQLLLPNSMSQLGPGVAWFDFDRDGDEDLVVGAGAGGQVAIFRNERGRLSRRAELPQLPSDATTILGLPSPDGRGSSLLVGLSNWETEVAAAVMGVGASAAGTSGTAQTLVPPQKSSTGPLALGDYDGDGDLDLFVGGRAIPGAYPLPASSALFRNDRGVFQRDSAATAILDSVGLVSGAMFADVNGDGRPDLVLAREWSSILLLLNQGGTFAAADDSWGLSRWTSRWNGVAAGDLDGDGRLDLVATSWGRNTSTPADSSRPLVAVHGRFGAGGEEELILARRDPRLGALAPLNGFQRLRAVIRDLSGRIKTFDDFADANVDDVLGAATKAVRQTPIVTLDHMAFLNRGDRFVAMPLPREAQESPAFSAGVADFDGDGNEDVLLSQNFYPTAIGMPRYDAGRGLLLLGDGAGGLVPMSGTRSGILVYGDQRGAAFSDFDADGRLDVVIAQNAAPTRLLRNQGARPGLRIRLKGRDLNADGVGAVVRLVFGERMGPAREVQAGSGYWSQNGAVQVFGLPATPTEVLVRWPGGSETRVRVPAGAREITVAEPRSR